MNLKLLPVVVAIVVALAIPVAAQTPVSVFESSVPVAIGDNVRGMVLYPMGTSGIATVRVTGYWSDDMTTYWRATYLGDDYVYDTYSGFWKPTPVSYEGATLEFQGRTVEGWVRYFGNRMDRNLFVGRDGDVYKRVNVTRKQRRGQRSRVRVMYTYFLNLRTLERSDGKFMPYYGMTPEDQQYVKEQSDLADAALAQRAAADPAFPQWNGQDEPAGEVVNLPAQPSAEEQRSLAELVEEQVGPVQGLSPQPTG